VQSLAGVGFKDAVKFGRDRLDHAAQVFESCGEISQRLVPFPGEMRQVLVRVFEGDVWGEETNSPL
jgi:hypothetical protein